MARDMNNRAIEKWVLAAVATAAVLAQSVQAEAPEGYYDGVDAGSAQSLRATLHPVIDDHTRFPYTSSDTDTWDVLELADEDPVDSGRIITLYRNSSLQKWSGGTSQYNREHTWPRSYGISENGPELNYPFTDMHHLFLADPDYNGYRSNKPFEDCDAQCSEWTTEESAGRGGQGGAYPGDSNWTDGEYTDGRWEVWDDRKGDIARAMFYMDLRYEGGTHGVTGADEPDLILTDDRDLIDSARTGQNEPVAYMGILSTLLRWNRQDPVDAVEMQHHETVASYQGNRNPFIDRPEWADCLFLDRCGVVINAGMNDAWYNPYTAGQGLMITVLPTFELVFLAMFTFETERPPQDTPFTLGEPGHRWITALGHYSGNTATLAVEITSGGVFSQAEPAVTQSDDGTFTLTFSDCNHAVLTYDMPGAGLEGTIPLERSVKDNAALCESLSQALQGAAQ